MSGQKPPIYWESPDEIEKIQKRRVIRQRLQTEFNRIAYNPYNLHNHVEFLDPSVSRYMAMRSSIYEYWKPNWRAFIKWSLLTYVPIILGAMQLKRQFVLDRDCRTGKIPYEKRDFRRM
ncbi:hypothetical protein SSS_02087 [Sarcoptes scabiei]|nr:hypothetical protein SSS_02087 [Sarcoptes scabiei]